MAKTTKTAKPAKSAAKVATSLKKEAKKDVKKVAKVAKAGKSKVSKNAKAAKAALASKGTALKETINSAVDTVSQKTSQLSKKTSRLSNTQKIAAGVGTAAVAIAGVAGVRAALKRRKDGAKVYHLEPKGEGWRLRAAGSDRAELKFETKDEGVTKARQLVSERAPSELVIHLADGSEQTRHSYEPPAKASAKSKAAKA